MWAGPVRERRRGLTTDLPAYMINHWFPGPPWEHAAHYLARSPISLVGRVTTPTMVITGEQDFRTPMSDSEQYYQALKLRRVESVLVRAPDEAHGIAGTPSHHLSKILHILSWFERHRGPRPDGEERGGPDRPGPTS